MWSQRNVALPSQRSLPLLWRICLLPSLVGRPSLGTLQRCCGEIILPSLIVALELLVFLDALEFLFSRGARGTRDSSFSRYSRGSSASRYSSFSRDSSVSRYSSLEHLFSSFSRLFPKKVVSLQPIIESDGADEVSRSAPPPGKIRFTYIKSNKCTQS